MVTCRRRQIPTLSLLKNGGEGGEADDYSETLRPFFGDMYCTVLYVRPAMRCPVVKALLALCTYCHSSIARSSMKRS